MERSRCLVHTRRVVGLGAVESGTAKLLEVIHRVVAGKIEQDLPSTRAAFVHRLSIAIVRASARVAPQAESQSGLTMLEQQLSVMRVVRGSIQCVCVCVCPRHWNAGVSVRARMHCVCHHAAAVDATKQHPPTQHMIESLFGAPTYRS